MKQTEYSLDRISELSVSILREIKQTLNNKGYWEGDYNNWDDIVAVCNLETMLTLGVTLDEKWIVKKGELQYETSLKEVIKYLDGRIKIKKGKVEFGEDLWDLFRLVNMIDNFEIDGHFSKYQPLCKYCKNVIKQKNYTMDTRWNGPAVRALAYEFAIKHNMSQLAEGIKKDLINLRNEDFSWGKNDDSPQMKVWHTSQVLKALSLAGFSDGIEESLRLISVCTKSSLVKDDYFLSTYYYSYAGIAYIYYKKTETNEFDEILDYILNKFEIGDWDRGASSMVAEFFATYLELSSLYFNPRRVNSFLLVENFETLLEENNALKEKNQKQAELLSKFENCKAVPKTLYYIVKWILIILGSIVATIITTLIMSRK